MTPWTAGLLMDYKIKDGHNTILPNLRKLSFKLPAIILNPYKKVENYDVREILSKS